MLDQKFVDKIEELRHHTYSRITELQQNLCPMVKNIFLNNQYYYWYEGYKYNLWKDDRHIYAVSEIPYCYDNEIKNTTFIDTLDHLVEQSKIWPFLLFINNEVIQWSKITIIHDYDYSYMIIDDIVPNYSFSAKIVVFPIAAKNIRYGEDNDVLTTSDRKGLYFNKGKRLENTDFEDIDLRLEILNPNIYFNILDLSKVDKTFTFEGLPDGYIPTIDNILTFNEDGTFNSNGSSQRIQSLYDGTFGLFNLLSATKEIKWAILMYNVDTSKQKSSLYNRMGDLNRKNIFELLKKNPNKSNDVYKKIISPLIQTFDFDHDYRKTYEENIADATKYITRYDYNIWKDTFLKDLNIKSLCYTGNEFKKLADNKGYTHFSRKHQDIIEEVAMVFVNHQIYPYMIDVTYTTNTINIPIFGIQDDDHVEIIIFTNCNNKILDIVIPDDKTPVYVHPEYNLDDVDLLSEYCPDAAYDIPDNLEGRKQYKIDYTYESLGDNKYLIKFDSPEYYGKTLSIVPKRQFRYYRYKQKENQSKVILPTQFNYCHDPNRYVIFINGRKIDRTEYTITIMNKYRPFDKLVLYVSTILDPGDYIDIFYIPEPMVEKYKKASIPKNGLLMLEDTDHNVNYPTTYPLAKDTVMLFINGLKVNPLDIKDISLNTLLLNMDDYKRNENGDTIIDDDGEVARNRHQVTSVNNISIMEFISGNKEISGYLEGLYEQIPSGEKYDPSKIDFNMSASDSWKHLIKTVLNEEVPGINLSTLFGDIHEIENPDANFKDNFENLRTILYDAVIDYYLATDEATSGGAFVYDFERDYFDNVSETNDTKSIDLFDKKDKLFDYQPVDTIAKPKDVKSGKKFIDASSI